MDPNYICNLCGTPIFKTTYTINNGDSSSYFTNTNKHVCNNTPKLMSKMLLDNMIKLLTDNNITQQVGRVNRSYSVPKIILIDNNKTAIICKKHYIYNYDNYDGYHNNYNNYNHSSWYPNSNQYYSFVIKNQQNNMLIQNQSIHDYSSLYPFMQDNILTEAHELRREEAHELRRDSVVNEPDTEEIVDDELWIDI
jgi:hypothetical protein